MSILAKRVLVVLIGMCLTGVTVAQRFSFDPSGTWEQEYYKDDYSSNQIIITNETTEALAFRWRLIANTFPAEWSYSICDLGSCFPVPPDSNDMNLTSVGGDAYFICHTSYNGFVGAGEIQLFVFEIGDEANGDTVIFRYTTTNVLGAESFAVIEEGLTVFPNPADDFIRLKTHKESEVSQVAVYNILGQPVIETKMNHTTFENVLEVGLLNPGQYFVTVSYANGERETSVFYKGKL